MEEEWRDTGYEKYQASNLGNVRRVLLRGKFKNVKGTINHGYKYLCLDPKEGRNEKRLRISFHRLIAKAFLGERPDGLVVDHIDRNRTNNNVNNLRYVTQRENIINGSHYRHDILETNFIERRKILKNESNIRIGVNQQILRKRGTGSVSKSQNGYRASIKINKIKYSKRCKTIEECEKYLKEIIENNPKL